MSQSHLPDYTKVKYTVEYNPFEIWQNFLYVRVNMQNIPLTLCIVKN